MTNLYLEIHDTLLERSLKELFDPLPNFNWSQRPAAHLVLSDHSLDSSENYILLDTLPLNAEKLLKEIELNLRNSCLIFGPNSLLPASKTLRTPEGEYKLTEKEVKLLTVLIRNAGKNISKEALLQEVWNYAPGIDTHTLETHIYRLRQKIEKDPAKPTILKNCEEGYFIQVE